MKALIITLSIILNFSSGFATVKDKNTAANNKIASTNPVVDTIWLNDLLIKPFQLEIVPPSSGIQFFRNGIIFLSHTKVDENVPENHLSFGSVRIYSSLIADTIPGNFIPFSLEGPALFPTEATTFTSDFNTMYLSLIPAKATSEKIFRADYSQNGWKIENSPLEICSGNYVYSHPCLSADGSFMIFSSDMPGTKGGLDLYITKKNGDSWGDPENLGKDVNSSGNDLFASLDSRNNLFFSSDGLPGEGGYDIFISEYNGSGWEKPQNLTRAINARDDELAFTINRADDKTAFFTSRARSGKSKTHLFILYSRPGIDATNNLTLADRFLASKIADESIAKPEKPQEVAKPVASNVFQEIKEEQPVMKTDPVLSTTAAQVKPAHTPETITDKVVYRVQITASTKPMGSQNITIAGKAYKSFEYLYKGGYRTTIGEFNSLTDAMRLQAICRQNSYPQAFVVAFINNVRSTDPELFK